MQRCLRPLPSEPEEFSRYKGHSFTQQVRFGLCCKIILLVMSRDCSEPQFGRIRAAVGNGDFGRASAIECSSSGSSILSWWSCLEQPSYIQGMASAPFEDCSVCPATWQVRIIKLNFVWFPTSVVIWSFPLRGSKTSYSELAGYLWNGCEVAG